MNEAQQRTRLMSVYLRKEERRMVEGGRKGKQGKNFGRLPRDDYLFLEHSPNTDV